MIKFYRFTDKELKELLKSIVVISDTREQENGHILKFFDEKKIAYKAEKLDFCDYSFYLPANPELGISRDLYFSDEIAVERKNSLEEISGNLCQGRTAFENEFIRAGNSKVHLLIENASYEDISAHKYKTEYNPKSFLASLHSFKNRYDLSVDFIKNRKYSGQFIYFTFYYWLRNYLLSR